MWSQGSRRAAEVLANLYFALGCYGCIEPHPEPVDASGQERKARGATPALAPALAPAPSTDQPPPAAIASGASPLERQQISLYPGKVLLDDQQVATLEPGHVKRLDALQAALTDSVPKDPQEHRPLSYRLTVADEVDAASLKSALQSASLAGQAFASLDVGSRDVWLRTLVPPSSAGAAWPVATLVLVARRDSLELFRTRETRNRAEPDTSRVASIAGQDLERGLLHTLATLCGGETPCSPALVFAENGSNAGLLKRALLVLANTAPETRATELLLEFRLEEPPASGQLLRVATPPRAAAVGAKEVSGRLPPELIQKVVRLHYGAFRMCYEAGLGRNHVLRGRVSARFVIGRDGRVSNVTNGGSDLSDAEVVSCVLKAFYPMRFLPPEGGKVTVVYPIMLEPG